jgi:hypothetical protein
MEHVWKFQEKHLSEVLRSGKDFPPALMAGNKSALPQSDIMGLLLPA